MRHFLDVDDLTPAEMSAVLELAQAADPPKVLKGKGVGLIFEKPSNRTRNATEMAVVALGGHPVAMRGEEVGLGVRESVEDVTKVLARYHALIGARVVDHASLIAMAAVDAVPVVNLLSDISHPAQALADLLTLRRHWGSLAGRRLAWVGDGNNVARSLVVACAMAGMEVSVASPPGYRLSEVVLETARSYGTEVSTSDRAADAVAGADAVATDVWVSMGQEAQATTRARVFADYCVDASLMAAAAPDAVFLHCLPAHRGMEVTAEVIDGPASLVWEQAANRMHVTRGLFSWLVGKGSCGR
jgi:ornithine carbamoyltransferase